MWKNSTQIKCVCDHTFLLAGQEDANAPSVTATPSTSVNASVAGSSGGAPSVDQNRGPSSQHQRWEMCGPWVSTCKRLLSVLLSADPRVKRLVAERRKGLTKAIEGLGQHGLIGKCPDSVPRMAVLIFVAFAQ